MFTRLAMFQDRDRGAGTLAAEAERRGLAVVLLPADPEAVTVVPADDLAWRCPAGFAAVQARRGTPLALTARAPSGSRHCRPS